MSCSQTILDYGLRSLGYGARLLPKTDFTLCQHFTLIGSGLIWNIYFGFLALLAGFFIANAVALAKASPRKAIRVPAEWFILVFRGSPLFIQFFLAYFIFLRLKQQGILPWLTAAQFGALLVLVLNTAAYSR
jgi:polar amino acid transport system permease protein